MSTREDPSRIITAYFKVKKQKPSGYDLYDLCRIIGWIEAEPELDKETTDKIINKHFSYADVIRVKKVDTVVDIIHELEHFVLEKRRKKL